ACVEQAAPVLERTELDLVDGGRNAGLRQYGVELGGIEVAHADRSRQPSFVRTLHAWPHPSRPALRPVDEVEVDPVHPEPAQALLCLGLRVLGPRIELRRDEHLVSRQPAVAKRLADALLVAVALGRIDVAIAQLERPAHGVFRLLAGMDLPDA